MKVIHVAAYHPAQDVRVFHKECRSLARAGYDVHLMIPQPPAKEIDGVIFHSIEPPKYSHLSYWFWTIGKALYRIYRQAKALDGDLYHFHEAELIYVGLLLKVNGKKVIFDAHEDYPRQAFHIDDGRLHRKLFASFLYIYLLAWIFIASRTFDSFIITSPEIAKRYPKKKSIYVFNYARLDEYPDATLEDSPYSKRPNHVFYVGGINLLRGIRETVQAIEHLPPELNTKFILAGKFMTPKVGEELAALPGWQHVEFLGWQNRTDLMGHMMQARIGIVAILPLSQYTLIYPTKLFEYMAAGLPVIASDFPVWREMLGDDAGLVKWVNPTEPESIAQAIEYLLTHPDKAEALARQGQEAVQQRYHWEGEAEKLIALYQKLLSSNTIQEKP